MTRRKRKGKSYADFQNEVYRRWRAIPASTYPYTQLPFPQPYQDTEAIIQRQLSRPYAQEGYFSACRPWLPEDLWETGALRKVIFNEINGDEQNSHEGESGRCVDDCLTHILACWNFNLKSYHSAGPSFLVHFLKYKYETGLNFQCLHREDSQLVELLTAACEKARFFHVFLARFFRTTSGWYDRTMSTESGDERCVAITEDARYWLEDVTDSRGKPVERCPSVSDVDLLNPYYFEDEEPDGRDCGDIRWSHYWKRSVVIIVPQIFADEFFNYGPKLGLEDESSNIEENEVEERFHGFDRSNESGGLDALQSLQSQESWDDSIEESEDDEVRAALEELEEARIAQGQADYSTVKY